MREVRLLGSFAPMTGYGSERANLRIFQALRSRGAKVHLINHKYTAPPVKEILDELDFETSQAVWGPFLGKNIFNILNLFLILRGILLTSLSFSYRIRKFKPSHLYFGNCAHFVYCSLALIATKIPLIYRMGDKIPDNVIWRLIFKLIAKRASRIVCISEFIKKNALANGISENKVAVIYCHPPSHEKVQNEKMAYRSHPDQMVIGFVGQIRPFKGVQHFVDAAIEISKQNRNVIFYLAGDYSYLNPFAEGEIEKVRKQGLEKQIVFLGFLDDPFPLYREMDIYCYPSIQGEPLGNGVLEAKSAGVPSVVFPDGGLPEMIEHEVDGFICREKTTEALQEGISFFMNDKGRLKRAKQRARESLSKFDWEKTTDRWYKILEDTIK